ncbi:MAG: Sodium/hydrogen exchanger [Candidatus Uhrbacteria bacterium GW2011_GWD2_41_121]|uniref:Sodium/hydrogen exchanger n=1 Tax=Candidatus Uhrbacteria bacterium GW2011_GWC1_41_20 TaxID=1618983 RepID=A0A0G0VH68_9BACT|nr:MAG: Sodium/hydrogen exchanger [Candidatus Uhrbacteria bacterium GW2011_GWE1_39_46]KKR63483.1 MAG: Sodium/hydrogen exchanger [Candidatus Uhrbacteria bacterium GW2011_GWC2_40_450]KKR89697.1 MAG: Sodium/hydrogen exchanger [Candidatus Uhrbacteria bacterium GW2011_GWD2_41_121]KKR95869.1 MAG: Sodium/hydrogen exchanger [Candidatus Uhrbacteria bacterium GW2011_GWD1_41_16]KKR99001.1 MAG: sodium/hydrogen exchanger [Candidatus Uhrbacteria bacterium GW2011_GWC1_41_20]KKS07208.1 MAG: Sodium/hydrogen ex
MTNKFRSWIYSLSFIGLIAGGVVAASGTATEGGHGASIALTFLWIAVILIAAKFGGLVEKLGQPAVLGELVIGVILGNLALVGLHTFEPILEDGIIKFLAELGVVILLFQIGLESNIKQMREVGLSAFLVAVVGVVLPFVLGTYVVGPWIMPGLDPNAYLFLGAALTATSVGITARVFKDLGKLHIPEAQIVLGAAVIDDVLGLVILAVVSAIVTVGAVSLGMIGWILAKAILFLVGSIVIGQLLAPWLGRMFAKIQTGIGMKFTLAIIVCLLFAYLAQMIGLAAIVGAFAAGLILDPVHFRYFKDAKIVHDVKQALKDADASNEAIKQVNHAIEEHSHRHIEDLIEPLAFFLVPIFFVLTGMEVKLDSLFDGRVLLVALAITLVAIVGKILAGAAAGKVNKLLVGCGMIPRGEVGLIFASIGKGLGVINDELFSVIVIMVILTTLLTPPILSVMLKKYKE